MMPEPISKPTEVFLRSEEHTSELQSQSNLVCRLLLEKKKKHVCVLFLTLCINHRLLTTVPATPPVAIASRAQDSPGLCQRYYDARAPLELYSDTYSSA